MKDGVLELFLAWFVLKWREAQDKVLDFEKKNDEQEFDYWRGRRDSINEIQTWLEKIK